SISKRLLIFFFSSRRRHTRSYGDWSSDVCSSDLLALKATDLDLEVTETIPAEVSPAGSTTVPAHMIYDIVRKLPEGSQIVLDSSGDRASLTIRAGRSRFSLQTLPESDFPDLAAGEMTHKFTLPAKDLKRLIDRTQFAISTEE